MEAFEAVLQEERPHWVVVVGDVNSTLACSLVTSKLRFELGCRLAHVEAGLRSGDWRMPEEVNRVLTDRLSDALLTPSPEGEVNLRAEGIEGEGVTFVGNVMIDTLLDQLPHARELDMPGRLGVERGQYGVVTLHRPSNVDHPEALRSVLEGLGRVAETYPVVFPVHPRTRKQVEVFGLEDLLEPLKALPPVSYREMIGAVADARVVLTDSGGLQEETTVLGVPCVTLREQTERPVTVDVGTNRLVPWPITTRGILDTVNAALEDDTASASVPEGWDGQASRRVVETLLRLRP
jgi:UDP-N-acetylglucosamine 2-epimerase (non-hydrolysing)